MEQVLAECPLEVSRARIVFESDLVRFLEEAGDFDAAAQVYRDTLAQRREHLPDNHPDVASALEDLGATLIRQEKYAQAEPVLRECLEIRQVALPADCWQTAQALTLIGESLAGRGEFAEAEPLLLEGYDQMRLDAYVPIDQLQHALERLIELYERWNKPEEAARWRKTLQAVRTEHSIRGGSTADDGWNSAGGPNELGRDAYDLPVPAHE